MAVHPFCKLGHAPVVEDARARVVAAEALGAIRRLADFLAMIEQHRAARDAEEHTAHCTSDIHADAAPMPVPGEPHFVVIFAVAQRIAEKLGAL